MPTVCLVFSASLKNPPVELLDRLDLFDGSKLAREKRFLTTLGTSQEHSFNNKDNHNSCEEKADKIYAVLYLCLRVHK